LKLFPKLGKRKPLLIKCNGRAIIFTLFFFALSQEVGATNKHYAFDKLSLHPFIYYQDFETEDPFKFWASNGTYAVHYKGITSEKSSLGNNKSLKLDVTLKTATYVYWMIPIKIPSFGDLHFRGDIFVEKASGAKVALGTNVSLAPCPHSGVNVLDRLSAPEGWVTQSSELVSAGAKIAKKLVAKYCGGATSDDVGIWTDKLGVCLYAPKGGRLIIYVDNIRLEGRVPDKTSYHSAVMSSWNEYKDRIQGEIAQLSDTISGYNKKPTKSLSQKFIKEAKAKAKNIKAAVQKRGYPTIAEYAELKELSEALNYIGNKSNQALTVYPWQPITHKKILPFTYPVPAIPGNSLSIQACRGEFEPASFIIRAQKDLSGIQISATDLLSPSGQQIPGNAVDIRLVKCWYQAGEGTLRKTRKKVLVPELLLRDDSLVKVDYARVKNFLKVMIGGHKQYIDISSPTAQFPSNAIVKDADVLQPFDMEADTNKQVWITVHVPEVAPSGDYCGTVKVDIPGIDTALLNLTITVLPFDIQSPALEYSLYYRGKLSKTSKKGINSEWKTIDQYRKELENMKQHGVLYPTLYQPLDDVLVEKALSLREAVGLPKEHLYVLGTTTGMAVKYEKGLKRLLENVKKWLNLSTKHDYGTLYIYGIDEARGDRLLSQRPTFKAVHNLGVKIFVACSEDAVDLVGDILDQPILHGAFKPTEVSKWHDKGKRVFIYSNPQVGVEDPEIYRRNFGISLWCAGYDGVMDYAYQHSFGHIWNDFDHKTYRDHVFAYPTNNGVIDTIQWEGFREGVDDVRYLSALIVKEGGNEAGIRTWLCEQLLSKHNLAKVRNKIIEEIQAKASAEM